MDNKDNELLIRGLTIIKELEFHHIPLESDIDYEFTEKYIRGREKLLNKIGHSYWKYINTMAKKVAIIIVVFIIVFSSMMAVDAFRDKFIHFIYNIYSTFTQIESKEGVTDKSIDQHYKFYPPPSFNQSGSITNEYMASTFWTNSLQQEISLTQFTFSDSRKFNSEHGELNEKIINNTICLICETNTDYLCYWEFDGYRFELIYPIDLGEEFMSEVVGHLVEVDPEELTTE